VVGEKQTTLYDLRTGSSTRTLDGQKSTTHVAFSSNSGLLAVSTYSGAIKLWDMKAGKWLGDFEGHKGRVSRTVFSPDGKLLASAGKDQTIKVWDVGQRCWRHPRPRSWR
jgi:WD40 repeat protein